MFATLRTFGDCISNDYMLCRVRDGNLRGFYHESDETGLSRRWSSQGPLSSIVPYVLQSF